MRCVGKYKKLSLWNNYEIKEHFLFQARFLKISLVRLYQSSHVVRNFFILRLISSHPELLGYFFFYTKSAVTLECGGHFYFTV